MTTFNDSKIINEARQVISSIELKLMKQPVNQNKQNSVDKLNSLMHYTCYLEKQNYDFYDKFTKQLQRIQMLENHIDNLQNKINVDKKIKSDSIKDVASFISLVLFSFHPFQILV